MGCRVHVEFRIPGLRSFFPSALQTLSQVPPFLVLMLESSGVSCCPVLALLRPRLASAFQKGEGILLSV